MNIHEYQARELLAQAGVPVPPGMVVFSLEEARVAAASIGYPVVFKAQVHTGGRGKAGGIRRVDHSAKLAETYSGVRSLVINGHMVRAIFVVKAIKIEKEFYLAVTVDPLRSDVVVLFSPFGGVEIEQLALTRPHDLHRWYLQGKRQLDPRQFAVVQETGKAEKIADILARLLDVFFSRDCSLAEINPLAVDSDGNVWAADGKISFDDNALFRHPELEKLRDPLAEDADEREAATCKLSFVKMTGEVGCIVNGAGLAMATMDLIQLCGGRPANFLDVGGSSNPQKMVDALRIVTRNTLLKVVLINIFGGITRCDDIARGFLEARRKITIPVPVVIRLCGTNEAEAKKILADEGITVHTDMRAAVEAAVALGGEGRGK